MAIFRKVHVSFWSDPFIEDLTPEQRYFYLYLMTNEHTKQCGIYEISKRQIAFETGYSIDRVSVLLQYFIKKGKIRYNDTTKELAMKNWQKYNASTSPKVMKCIQSEFSEVKDRVLIEYINSIDTLSQEEEEQEEDKDKDKEPAPPKPEPKVIHIPTQIEFVTFGISLVNDENYRTPIEGKYEQWLANGWKDGNGKVVKDWKAKLKSTIPYLKPLVKNESGQRRELK